MITNLMEGTRPKCAQYWPDYGSTEYGPFRVALTDEMVYADYTIRIFLVTVSEQIQPFDINLILTFIQCIPVTTVDHQDTDSLESNAVSLHYLA